MRARQLSPATGWLSRVQAVSMGHNPAADHFANLRIYGVSEGFKSVHPAGNPISHSTHVGFSSPGLPVRFPRAPSCHSPRA